MTRNPGAIILFLNFLPGSDPAVGVGVGGLVWFGFFLLFRRRLFATPPDQID